MPQVGNSSIKSLAYTTLVHPILEYGAVCCNPYRDVQIQALNLVQKIVTKFAYNTNKSNWESLTQHRKISHVCPLFKAYAVELAWKAIGDRLKQPNYLSRVDHKWKIRKKDQRMDIGKYSVVNRTINLWNSLPVEI
jgi:hypothetical protein